MSVTPEEAAAFIRARSEQRERALDSRYAVMKGAASRIIARTVKEFHPIRIYQWGSLLDRSRFRAYSDIDIAVEGVTSASDWLRLERTAWEESEFPLDLVQLEHVEPEYADIIREKGVVVYERPD